MIRVSKFELVFPKNRELRSAMLDRWFPVLDDCRMIANRIWTLWRRWHTDKEHDVLLHEWWTENRGKSKKDRKKCPLKPSDGLPSELQKIIRDDLHQRFAHVYGRIIELLVNTSCKTIRSKRDADGWMKGWMAVLLDRQSQDSIQEERSIPFDKHSMSKILPPLTDDGNFRLAIRMDRHDKKSTLDTVELLSRRRNMRGQAAVLRAIVEDRYAFKGSHLTFHRKKRKWFAHICYEQPELTPIDLVVGNEAILIPRHDIPLGLVIGGWCKWIGQHGRYVAEYRRKIAHQRWDRQAQYRWAGHGSKGHGRNKLPVNRMRRDWRRFVTTCNQRYAAEIMRICAERRIARLIYYQPVGDRVKNGRFLCTTGKTSRRESSGWDWYQLGKCLNNAAPREVPGMEVEIRRWGEGRSQSGSAAVSGQ